MNYAYEFARLREFVREIQVYYRLNQNVLGGYLVVSRAMVSFALNGLSDNDLNILLETLRKEGYLVSTGNDRLIFPASFIEADC
jgi:predicted membrane GTPase involved in stress response